jgi:hypothetical protein
LIFLFWNNNKKTNEKLILIMAVSATTASFGQSPLKYPQTKKGVVDTYFGTQVNDPTDGWKTTVLMRQLLG